MKEIQLEIAGIKIIATYKIVFRHLVEVELIEPYKGLQAEFAKVDDECNLFDEVQAEELVTESLFLLMRQIDNVERYRPIYQTLIDDYKRITDTMSSVLRSMEMKSRDKFKYHIQLLDKMREEFNNKLKSMIPVINDDNQHEFLIHPSLLSKILIVI